MASKDRIGGYTLDELLGSKPIGAVEQKPGLVAKIVGAPVRLLVGVVKLPFVLAARLLSGLAYAFGEVLRLPVRMARAVARPWKKRD